MSPLVAAAVTSTVVLIAAPVGFTAWLRRVARDDDTGIWQADQLAAIPRPAGRHRAVGYRAADLIGRAGWQPRHSEDEVPWAIRHTTMELPIVDRARVLAWELGPVRPHVPPPPRRVRRAQLELARRLRAAGIHTILGPRRAVLP